MLGHIQCEYTVDEFDSCLNVFVMWVDLYGYHSIKIIVYCLLHFAVRVLKLSVELRVVSFIVCTNKFF
jgi:hypothetical protein